MTRRVSDEDAAELTDALSDFSAYDICEVCAVPEDLHNLLLDRTDDIAEIERLRKLIDSMDAAIERYGQHEARCAVYNPGSNQDCCTCGLWEAQVLARQALPKEGIP